jgi:hypothetical protein
MKRAILGTLVGVGVVMVAVAVAQQRGEMFAQRAAPTAATATATAGTELIVTSALLADKAQMLTVVDPRQRVVAVYQIELATGKIALKSARNIQWDLQISDMNTEAPLPQQIQSMLGK